MRNGKKICEHLKLVRKQIADANGIPYEITECPHQGPCAGTCPKCESELRYIENQLSLRRAAGKAVSLVGLSLGISTAFMATGCTTTTKTNDGVETVSQKEDEYEIQGDVVNPAEYESVFMSKDTVEKSASYITDVVTDEVPEEILAQFEKMKSGDSTVQIDKTTVFTVAEKQPEFPGGVKAMESFIKENLRYPDTESCAQGRVVLSFIVEIDGTISNIEVMRSPWEEFTKEAIRVVKLMPKWKSGTIKDTPVRVLYVLPVSFVFD